MAVTPPKYLKAFSRHRRKLSLVCRQPEDVWVVYKNPENPMQLKSADIIAVCKRTGRILYEGTASDEG